MAEVSEKSPIYLQLREVVRERIESGEYAPGTDIPSENALAKTYGVNRLTVRSALDALVEEGMLKRVQGKGVFVVGRRIERDLDNLTGFRQSIRGSKSVPGTKVLERERRKAGLVFAQRLGIDEGDDIFYVKRLNSANGEPISVEHVYVPCDLIPNLGEVDLEVFSLYDAYEFYGHELVRAYQTLDIVTLEVRTARALKVPAGSAALLFTCTSYDAQGRIVEFVRSFNRSDSCYFTVRNGERRA